MKAYASCKMGPGGLKCACCNPWFHSSKKGKPVYHRFLRRKAKVEAAREVYND